MVQSSYKNRKKNRKQSFKRKNTDGNRKVKFIDDDDKKMVGGDDNTDKTNIAGHLDKYREHPLQGLVRSAFSNAPCAYSNTNGTCNADNISILNTAFKKCTDILKYLPELSEDGHKKPQASESLADGPKLAHITAVIDYLFQNVFIPKDLIQHVYVENNEGNEWTTLTNAKFVKIKEGDSTERKAKLKAEKKIEAQLKEEGDEEGEEEEEKEDEGKEDERKVTTVDDAIAEMDAIVNKQGSSAGGENKLKKIQKLADEFILLYQKSGYTQQDSPLYKTLNEIKVSESANDAIDKWKAFKKDESAVSGQQQSEVISPQQERLNKDQLDKANTNLRKLVKQIDVIAKKEEGVAGDVEKMKTLIRELRDLIRYIRMNSSANTDVNNQLDDLMQFSNNMLEKQRSFKEMSTRWNEETNKK